MSFQKSESKKACDEIEKELKSQIEFFKSKDQLIEAQRIEERTEFDIEMLKETGFCSGIENYTRYMTGQKPGEPPMCLMDYFGDDYLIIIDESHETIPQIGAMYRGNLSRKKTLVDYGFRLPSALDNRPLDFQEFEDKIDKMLFVSATPGKYEKEREMLRTEQVIRPTGLLDPEVFVRKSENQIDDVINEINKETKNHGKVMITTLTKKMAEELTAYLKESGIRIRYIHSDIDTLERAEIIRDLRLDKFDVIVGINLLREGIDIPEITLVAILEADKEGFLRDYTSLIQTIGRAARNDKGHVIMYADTVTKSMKKAIDETNRRRTIQKKYNDEHNITPKTIQKAVREVMSVGKEISESDLKSVRDSTSMDKNELIKLSKKYRKRMEEEAKALNFEAAAEFRDRLIDIKNQLKDMEIEGSRKKGK